MRWRWRCRRSSSCCSRANFGLFPDGLGLLLLKGLLARLGDDLGGLACGALAVLSIGHPSTLQRGNASITEESSAYEIQVAQLDDQLRKCHITSPICGTVLAKYAEAGELATQGKPLFKVADVQHLFLRAYITADQLSQLKLGDKVKVFSDLGEDDRREYEGTITWISDKSEFTPKTIQTRDERANLVYATKIAVKNDGYIKIGMYGEMKK